MRMSGPAEALQRDGGAGSTPAVCTVSIDCHYRGSTVSAPVAPVEQPRALAVVQQPAAPVAIGYGTVEGFVGLQRVAKAFSESRIVPDTFRGNVADCIIALEMANRMGASPLMVMQNMHVIHGRVGWSSQFLISAFNSCGRFGPIRYRWTGTQDTDTEGCVATSRDLATGEAIEGPEVTVGMAKAEGWFGRNGSKWKTMRRLMLTYRAAAFLVRTTAPELTMGIRPVDELEDMDLPAPRWVAPVQQPPAAASPPPAADVQASAPVSPPPPPPAAEPEPDRYGVARATGLEPDDLDGTEAPATPDRPRVGRQLAEEVLKLCHAVDLSWSEVRAEHAEDLGLTPSPVFEQDAEAMASLRAVLKAKAEEKEKRRRKTKAEAAGAAAEGGAA